MIVVSERFGEFDLDSSNIIDFPYGLPGFEDLKKFVLLRIEETRPVFWLQSIDNKYISIPTIIPFEIIDDYSINIRDNELEPLGIVSQKDLLVMNVVVIPGDITKMTANMAAPIIIDTKIGKGKQVIIDAEEMSIKYPIFDKVMATLMGGEDDASSVKEEG